MTTLDGADRVAAAATGLTSGRLLARNAILNLLGQGAPILLAVGTIPVLIRVLGTDRFGVLSLAWVVMVYFGLFDLGLGRATTRAVAECEERGDREGLPELVWSSVSAHLALGVVGGGVLALLTPWLTASVLNIPAGLLVESRHSFYLLAASVPLTIAALALRGVLEALQRFDLVNAVKIPAAVVTYAGPLAVLFVVDSLTAVVALLTLNRAAVLAAHLVLCRRALPELRAGFAFRLARITPLLRFGGWITLSSLVFPTLVALDRFLIGAFVSLSALALYVTPYEAITKLTIFPTSLLAVLFPAFSALSASRGPQLRRLYRRALRYLLAIVAPPVGVLLALSHDLLAWWVAPDFARDSAPVARWLLVGVLVNMLAYVPLTALHGIGRADVPAKLQLAQLPGYVAAVWAAATSFGIAGVALVWALRAAVDAGLLFLAAARLLPAAEGDAGFPRPAGSAPGPGASRVLFVGAFLTGFAALAALPGELLAGKVLAVLALGAALLWWEWRHLLGAEDRQALGSVLRPARRPPDPVPVERGDRDPNQLASSERSLP